MNVLRRIGSRLARLAELGVDTGADEELRQRMRLFTLMTVASMVIAVPFIFLFSRLQIPVLSIAIIAGLGIAILDIWWVSRTRALNLGGVVISALVYALVVLTAWFSGGIDTPTFGWFYIVPLYAVLMVNARAGLIFAALVLVTALSFWLAPNLGIEIPNAVPAELRATQGLASRIAAIAAIAVLLGALASQRELATSRLRRINEQLRAERDQVIAAERLATIGTLAASIGHEINNPLAYVIGNLEYVQEQVSDEGELREALDDALTGAHLVRRLARDLRTFADRQAYPIEAIDAAKCVQRAVTAIGLERAVAGTIDVDLGDRPSALANPAALRQLLSNLLANAADAIEGRDDGRIGVTVAGDRQQVTIDVSDNGPGVDPKIRDRIFEPYFTTRREHLQTGMGLAIARNLAALIGAELVLHESDASGSTFRVTLSRAETTSE